MGTKTLMTVDEYLHTTFDGADREYLDGEVVERNMGNRSHGRLQARIAAALQKYEPIAGIYVVVEVRQKVTATRYRIPDVAVFERDPDEEVPSVPPLAAIEVLSPDDRISYILPKIDECRTWGVKHIWIADPEDRKLFTYNHAGLHEVTEFAVKEHGIVLAADQIFEAA